MAREAAAEGPDADGVAAPAYAPPGAQGPSMSLLGPGSAAAWRRRGRGGAGGAGGEGPGGQIESASSLLLSLRQACCHPQLTRQWKKEQQTDLQLETGGFVSMDEVMRRIMDAVGQELQALERELCRALNARAAIKVPTRPPARPPPSPRALI
eukprot:tig00020710_g13305.t1